jgi:predicted amidohydrolase
MQLRAHDRGDFPNSVDRIVDAVRQAASESDLVVLPEATFPAYVLGFETVDATAIATAIARLRQIAAATRTVIVGGAAFPSDAGARNGAFVIDANGSLAGRADKLFLWHFDRRWFEPGDQLEPIATALGPLGVLVCADGRLPTIARALVDRGAVALVMPTAWVTSGRDPQALENVQADLLARVRAYENGVPFIAANKCGSELGMVAYCGKSQIVDSRGEIVAIAAEREPQTLAAAVTIAAASPHRTALPNPPARVQRAGGTIRIAISFDPLPNDVDDRLELLDDAYALAPCDDERLAAIDRAIPIASVGDELALDPGGLVPYRRAGYPLIRWTAELDAAWTERIARARALELRLYVVVFDRSSRRAFAVDPDGTIVAGTFDDYRLASFVFDPRKAAETAVAPGTDVRDGLERVAALIE